MKTLFIMLSGFRSFLKQRPLAVDMRMLDHSLKPNPIVRQGTETGTEKVDCSMKSLWHLSSDMDILGSQPAYASRISSHTRATKITWAQKAISTRSTAAKKF